MKTEPMHVISFKNTRLFKVGFWLSAAALSAASALPGILDGSFQRDPIPHASALCMLGVCCAYFLWRVQPHRLADEVVDCGDHLRVRRGRTEESIPFSNILLAEVVGGSGIHRISIRLRESSRLGRQVTFLPQASLWSNLPRIQHVAASLTNRAKGA